MDSNLKQITGDNRMSKYVVSDYLGSGQLELDKDYLFTIDKLWHGMISTGGKPENQIVASFRERYVEDVEVKPMILNATNRRTLKKLYGGDTAAILEGKQVYIYVETGVKDPRGGGTTEGLRIRFRRPVPPREETFICAECGHTVAGVGKYTAAQIATVNQRRYGMTLCADCSGKRKAAEATQNPTESNPAGQEDVADDSAANYPAEPQAAQSGV